MKLGPLPIWGWLLAAVTLLGVLGAIAGTGNDGVVLTASQQAIDSSRDIGTSTTSTKATRTTEFPATTPSTGTSTTPTTAPPPSTTTIAAPPPATTTPLAASSLETLDAMSVLSQLRVEAPHLGAPVYDRGSWKHWIDADRNGCDTRAEVLRAEATAVPSFGARCPLGGGQWRSTYDSATVTSASDLEVDHVVALAEAHRSGGWQWDRTRKQEFANDLSDGRTLAAVTTATNRAKSDQDPAGWLPEQNACTYIGDWIAIKARWDLSIDAEEASALIDLLQGHCLGLHIAGWGSTVTSPTAAPVTTTTREPPASASTAATGQPVTRRVIPATRRASPITPATRSTAPMSVRPSA